MKCPECKTRAVEIVPSGGFTATGSPLKECGNCGAVWRVVPGQKGNELDIIKKGTITKTKAE